MTPTPSDGDDAVAPILVVDDRADSLQALCAVLEPLGQPILTARSGDEALRHLLKQQVAVILLDVNMPGLDGFSTATLIKRRERTRDIPIIFLTADRDASDRGQVQLGYSSGAVDFLVKPFDPRALVSKVNVFVALHRSAEQLRRQVIELEASRSALSNAQRIARLAHFTVDVSTGRVEWSAGASQLFGVDAHGGSAGAAELSFWKGLLDPPPGRELAHLQTTLPRPDGTPMTVVGRAEYVRDRAGQLVSVRATLQDVTEQEQTRQALVAATDALHREHEVVTLLQTAMLPTALPNAPALDIAARYLPAEVGVGGDWYDASLRPDGQVLLAIGDVAGHGLGAATTMNEIRIASRAFSLIDPSPGHVLQHLNDFSQFVDKGDLVTALIILLDPVTGAGRVASAGHLPPIVVDDDGARLLELRVSPPVGTTTGRPHETSFTLRPGARLVMYTDGLVEQRHRSLDERLQELSDVMAAQTGSADELVDVLVRRLLPDGQPTDDVAVLAVQRAADPILRIRLPARGVNLAPIRAMVRRWLVANGATADETSDVVLAVGELISNACSHAYVFVDGMVTVEAEMVDGAAHLAVIDQGAWRQPQDRGGGRGLGIVRAVVDHVDIDCDSSGTVARIVRRLEASTRETILP